MNRRGFLRTLGLGVVGAASMPYLPALSALVVAPRPDYTRCTVPLKSLYARIEFKDIPFVFDADCPAGRVYFLNAMTDEMSVVVRDLATYDHARSGF